MSLKLWLKAFLDGQAIGDDLRQAIEDEIRNHPDFLHQKNTWLEIRKTMPESFPDSETKGESR